MATPLVTGSGDRRRVDSRGNAVGPVDDRGVVDDMGAGQHTPAVYSKLPGGRGGWSGSWRGGERREGACLKP